MEKRDRYGTVLVDLTNRKIIDSLIDREASTLEKWLKDNPAVVIISRDRYGKYIQGATNGAPDALQPVPQLTDGIYLKIWEKQSVSNWTVNTVC